MTVSGIDFGTSNSSVSYIRDGSARLVRVEGGHNLIPTALFFPDSGEVLYGSDAIHAFGQGRQGRLMRSIKRILGSAMMDHGTTVGRRIMGFDRIIGMFIKHLKQKLDAEVGGEVDSVVMGRPVHFRDNSQDEDAAAERQLRDIAHASGFKHIEFQFEPIAAAFAHERRLSSEVLALVIDVGGGTSDFTVIKVGGNFGKADRRKDILANTGVRVGGNDFDKALSLYGVMPQLGRNQTYGIKELRVPYSIYSDLSEWSNINFAYTSANMKMVKDICAEAPGNASYARLLDILEQERAHELLDVVERAKIDLTETAAINLALSCIRENPSVPVTRAQFDGYIADSVAKIKRSMHECLDLAGVAGDKIKIAILTGGSTEIPLIKSTVMSMLSSAVLSEDNKFSSVGEGLAYDAVMRFGERRVKRSK